jgi:MFS transporter, AAHS family, 4-hydroxybenzoate transporter
MIGYNLAGLAGAVTTALLLKRFGSRRLFVLHAVSASAVSVAVAALVLSGITPLSLLAGYMVVAGFALTALLQTSYPLAATVYPTDFRATGIGSAFGFGRLGAVSSSAVTASLIAIGGPALFFLGVATAAAGIAGATLSVRRHIAAEPVLEAAQEPRMAG